MKPLPWIALALLTACSAKRAEPPPSHPDPPAITEVGDHIRRWFAEQRLAPPVDIAALRQNEVDADLTVQLRLDAPGDCGEQACGAATIRSLEQSGRGPALFADLVAFTGLPLSRLRIQLDAPPCWRRELTARPDGTIRGTFTILCKQIHLPLACFDRKSVGDRPIAWLMTRFETAMGVVFQSDDLSVYERDADLLELHVSIHRDRARVIPGSWEILELTAIFSDTPETVCVRLLVDGRHASTGFRRPPEAEFQDLQPAHDSKLREFASRTMDAFIRTVTP